MRNACTLVVLLCAIYLQSQESSGFKVLGKQHQYQFSKADNSFTICDFSEMPHSCGTYPLKNEDDFRLPEMQKNLKDYFQELVEQLSSYENLEIAFNHELLKKNSRETIIIKKPFEVSAFLIEITEFDSVISYSIKPIQQALEATGELKLEFQDDIVAKDSIFTAKVLELVMQGLDNNKETIQKEVQQNFNDAFDKFYRDKVKKTKDYVYLTTEEIVLPDNPIDSDDIPVTDDSTNTSNADEVNGTGVDEENDTTVDEQNNTTVDEQNEINADQENNSTDGDSTPNPNDSNPRVDKTTDFLWYRLIDGDNFHLKVISSTDPEDLKIYGPYETSIGESDFVQKVFEQHLQFKQIQVNKLTLEKIHALIRVPLQEVFEKEQKKIQNNRLVAVADSIENINTTYSGQMILNRKFKLYPTRRTKKVPKTFEADTATISFFNNRADNIVIRGTVENKRYVIINTLFSLPLREFNKGSQSNTLSLSTENQNENSYKYYYDEVFDYLPDTKYNYAVKSEEIQLLPDKPVRLKERKLMDYFTGIFFSDFLGLNNNNTNGLIVAEAQMRVPLHLRNYGVLTLGDNITVFASANLFSGFENSSRKILLDDVPSQNPETFIPDDLYRFRTDNFNLLLNNNVDAGIRTSIATLEWKGASSFIHLKYGLRFLRTGVEYNLNKIESTENGDSSFETLFEKRDFQVFAVGQELDLNFEIRPQSNIGADLTVGLNWFGATGTSKNDIKFNTSNNSPNLKVIANLYALTNPNDSKSGLYFRLGGHYDTGNYKLFPQILVGYATNLTSFVNRVQPKNGKK